MQVRLSVVFRLAALALLLSGAPTANAAPPIEFKGLQLGASLDQAKEMFPMLACVPGVKTGVTECVEASGWNRHCARREAYDNEADYEACQRAYNSLKTYAGLRIKRIALVFRDGSFTEAHVFIDPATYEQIVETISAKYGNPTSETSESVQNRFGARYENSLARWMLTDGYIGVNRYGSTLDTGIVILVSRDEVKESARRKPTPQQRSKDL